MAALESRILAGESIAAPNDPAAGTFRREGEFWTIAFEGDAFPMKDSKGPGYPARLLQRPGQELSDPRVPISWES